MGISYFAMNAWRVAALQPPHLAAIVPWEGALDTVPRRQPPRRHRIEHVHARWARTCEHADDATPRAAAAQPRAAQQPSCSTSRSATQSSRTSRASRCRCSRPRTGAAPAAPARQPRGLPRRRLEHKQLRIHVGDHSRRSTRSRAGSKQKRFLDHWLHGIDTGITREPPIKLAVRRGGDRYVWRYEYEWPLARTQWTPYFLDAPSGTLRRARGESASSELRRRRRRAGRRRALVRAPAFD